MTTPADSVTPATPMLIISPSHRAHVRSPVDVLRLIVGVVLIVGGMALANLLDSTLLGLSVDGTEMIDSLPAWMRDVPAAALAVAVVAAAAGAVAVSLITTRYRRLVMLSAGFVAAAGLSMLIGALIYSMVDQAVQRSFDTATATFRYRGADGRVGPGDPLLAGAVAMVGIAGSYIAHTVTRRLALFLALYAAVSTLATGVPALALVSDVGCGVVAASAVLLLFGRHDLAPDAGEIVAALDSIGVELTSIERLSVDARGSAPWIGRSPTGEQVFVKALGRDERSADLLFRAYRWMRFRKTGDHRPFVSLRRAVEHEALVSLQAAALGSRTPSVLGVADAGLDGMVLAYRAVDGGSADVVEELDDDLLVATWEMVHELHSARIAHRDLRLANIFVDTEGRPWLIDFGFSEVAASDQLLGTDVAELLASTAARVGPERAVAAAHRATDLAELEWAMPWLQPLALSTATRQDLGGERGLAPIRTLLVEQCGVPEEEPVKLERVSGKSLFIVATIGLSAWFLIPQLADIDDIWEQVRGASSPWAAAAVGFSMLTYLAATASLLGAIPIRLHYWPAFTAQIASSFANRITPAKVGGLATNIRYFQKQGVPTAVSVTAVGLNAIAGVVVHVLLTLGFLLLASGDGNAKGLTLPSTSVTLFALAVVATVAATSVVLPVIRRQIVTHVLPQLRSGWEAIKAIGHRPGRLVLLFGGSATITMAYLFAMFASLQAFGSTASFPLVALLFLTGSIVANAAPTPGGLGAAEAALIAALSTVEETAIVVPAVFLYRFVTFWLPIAPGWLALTFLRQTDRI